LFQLPHSTLNLSGKKSTVPPSQPRLSPPEERTNDAVFSHFLEHVEKSGLELYPTQEAALLEIYDEKNVILNTPTGSGKSLVAAGLHFKALCQGSRSVYTCPIKALVNEKWLALCREFGPENVGLSTGDATVNRDAPILCCTAEILANIALRDGAMANVADVIADEFHYYADRDRGVAWQVPLLALSRARFLLMSATLGETRFFERALTELNGRETVTVSSSERPVPLEHSYSDATLAHTLEKLVEEKKSPVYVVHFTQLEAARSAQGFTSINIASREEKAALADAIADFKFNSPYGPDVKRWLRHGIGLHHAGLLPKYRVLVEQLAQANLLKVICGTDTLGVGVNVPIRTVVFTRLCKYDGEKTAILSARDFHQIGGRAGRKGFDDKGWVVVQAPEHVVENQKLEEKKARGGKKFVRRKPPQRNFVNWDKKTFLRLVDAPPERLSSCFRVSHGMLLNVLSRDEDGCEVLRDLIKRSHETAHSKRQHRRRAWQLFRSLLDLKVIEFIPPKASGRRLRVGVDLQEDFSLDQALSLYLVDTIPLLVSEDPEYPFDLLTLVESILENPVAILRKQLDKIKTEAVARMKQEGVEYDERMEELEKLEYPKPHKEFIYSTFNQFAARHPWVGQESIRPKSIAREMFEEYLSFSDYVRKYDMHRSEGLLLRHISGVHKNLRQTVPDSAKTDAVREMEIYLRAMIRQVDSSLLDEWEKLNDPRFEAATTSHELRPPGAEEAERDITSDSRVFLAAIRTRIFTFLKCLVLNDPEEAIQALDTLEDANDSAWTVQRFDDALEAYYAEHQQILLNPAARNARHTHVVRSGEEGAWIVQQVLVDPEEFCDWIAEFQVDVEPSRERNEPVVRLLRFGPMA
jgi:superfamily II RNA helicase